MVVSKTELPLPHEVLPGRLDKQVVAERHCVTLNTTIPPFPENAKLAMFGMVCFWAAEKLFWMHKGVVSTQVGYSAGTTPNPTYEELCTGLTGHTEVVRIVYNPDETSYEDLLAKFWDNHDPTQGMKQGIDIGTQYRSGIYYYNGEHEEIANQTKIAFQAELDKGVLGTITTEILPVSDFYYAEDYHQQYLHKNPGGFCSLTNVGASCPRGITKKKVASTANV